MTETEIVQKLAEIDSRSKSNTHRLDKLEDLTSSVNSLANSVSLMAQKQESMDKKLDVASADVKALKSAPAENWKTVTKAVLGAVVAAIIGYALAHLGL